MKTGGSFSMILIGLCSQWESQKRKLYWNKLQMLFFWEAQIVLCPPSTTLPNCIHPQCSPQQILVAYPMAIQTSIPIGPKPLKIIFISCVHWGKRVLKGTQLDHVHSTMCINPCSHYVHNREKLQSKCRAMRHQPCKLRHNYKMGYDL